MESERGVPQTPRLPDLEIFRQGLGRVCDPSPGAEERHLRIYGGGDQEVRRGSETIVCVCKLTVLEQKVPTRDELEQQRKNAVALHRRTARPRVTPRAKRGAAAASTRVSGSSERWRRPGSKTHQPLVRGLAVGHLLEKGLVVGERGVPEPLRLHHHPAEDACGAVQSCPRERVKRKGC